MGTTSVAPAPTEPKMSAMDRVINVFVAPSKTFTDLNRDPSWWVAWLLITVFAALFIFAMQKQVGFDQISRNEIAASPKAQERIDKLNPEAREQQLAMQTKITQYITYFFPVTILIFAAIMAAVLMAVFNFGMGSTIKFGMMLAVVMWGWVPGILKSLLAAISLFAGVDPEGFNVRNPAATNLGFFINRGDHPVLHGALSYVDIFAIWYIILFGIGISCVSKVKRNTATWTIAGLYIVFALIATGFTALFS